MEITNNNNNNNNMTASVIVSMIFTFISITNVIVAILKKDIITLLNSKHGETANENQSTVNNVRIASTATPSHVHNYNVGICDFKDTNVEHVHDKVQLQWGEEIDINYTQEMNLWLKNKK